MTPSDVSNRARFETFLRNWRGLMALSAVLIMLVVFEVTRPAGLRVSDLTGGVVTFNTLVRVGIFSIVIVGLNLLMGFAGQVSLGHAAFVGIGAFTTAIFTTQGETFGLPLSMTISWWWPWVLMVLGMMISGFLAYWIGKPVLRLEGHYLAMATLGIGIVIFILFRENFGLQLNSVVITGGFDGLTNVPRARIGSVALWPIERFYIVVWVFAIAAIAVGKNIVDSRSGRALRSIRGSQLAASVMGIDTTRYKARIFAISAVFASLAGSLFAHFQAAVSPSSFGFEASVAFVVMAAIGGSATIWGAPLGVVIVLSMEELLRSKLHLVVGGSGTEFEPIFFGLTLILIMIFLPGGVAPEVRRLGSRFRGTGVSRESTSAGDGT